MVFLAEICEFSTLLHFGGATLGTTRIIWLELSESSKFTVSCWWSTPCLGHMLKVSLKLEGLFATLIKLLLDKSFSSLNVCSGLFWCSFSTISLKSDTSLKEYLVFCVLSIRSSNDTIFTLKKAAVLVTVWEGCIENYLQATKGIKRHRNKSSR